MNAWMSKTDQCFSLFLCQISNSNLKSQSADAHPASPQPQLPLAWVSPSTPTPVTPVTVEAVRHSSWTFPRARGANCRQRALRLRVRLRRSSVRVPRLSPPTRLAMLQAVGNPPCSGAPTPAHSWGLSYRGVGGTAALSGCVPRPSALQDGCAKSQPYQQGSRAAGHTLPDTLVYPHMCVLSWQAVFKVRWIEVRFTDRKVDLEKRAGQRFSTDRRCGHKSKACLRSHWGTGEPSGAVGREGWEGVRRPVWVCGSG